jgi:hypothetical protein
VVVKALTLVLLAGIMVSFIIQLHSVPLIQKLSLGLDLDLDFLCLIKNNLKCPLRFSEDDESDTEEEDMEQAPPPGGEPDAKASLGGESGGEPGAKV